MLLSYREIVTDEFDTLYTALKSKGVTMSALLAKAVALTLRSHPVLNAAYDPSGAIRYNKDINIAMAVNKNLRRPRKRRHLRRKRSA